jgi:hypothetical protein
MTNPLDTDGIPEGAIRAALAERGPKFTSAGAQTVSQNALRHYVDVAQTIEKVRISLGTAPVGSAFIVDVQKNGVTVFTTTANRPSIAAAGHSAISVAPDVTALAPGDYLTYSVIQIGSGTAGSDLVVQVRCL